MEAIFWGPCPYCVSKVTLSLQETSEELWNHRLWGSMESTLVLEATVLTVLEVMGGGT